LWIQKFPIPPFAKGGQRGFFALQRGK